MALPTAKTSAASFTLVLTVTLGLGLGARSSSSNPTAAASGADGAATTDGAPPVFQTDCNDSAPSP